jgi:hypothetical protein
MTPFDRKLALRSLAYTATAGVVAAAVVVTTDEPSSTTALRAARIAAFLPALAALGSAVALRHIESRGEALALSALGASPLRVALGASFSGWVVGIVAVALVASPLADVKALFPAALGAPSWLRVGADFVNPAHGVLLGADGSSRFVAASAGHRDATAPGVRAALSAIAPLALVLPLWQSAPIAALRRAFCGVAALGLLLGLLHAVAARKVSDAALLVPALPLAVQAALAHRRGA